MRVAPIFLAISVYANILPSSVLLTAWDGLLIASDDN